MSGVRGSDEAKVYFVQPQLATQRAGIYDNGAGLDEEPYGGRWEIQL